MRAFIFMLMLFVPFSGFAENLMQVYQDACANDPTFKAANAEFYAIHQDIPISVANFLPQIVLTGELDRSRINNYTSVVGLGKQGVYYNDKATYGIYGTQSLFNYANWASLSTATATAKSAAANLCAAAQDLMLRTSTAYFAVLGAYDDLRFLTAEKKSIAHQLRQTKERYNAGLIAITAVYEAQAVYDSTSAQVLEAENAMANRVEELREITGKSYVYLTGVRDNVPLISPQPKEIDRWVEMATRQNYRLQAACFAAKAAQENVKLKFAGHLPVVNATAGYTYLFEDNPAGLNLNSQLTQSTIGVDATVPLFSGGGVYAVTKQARYQYQQALSLEERTRRSVISNTRKSYLATMSLISQVNADIQTIKSRNSQLEATMAAYDVGARTMVDVLTAQSALYDSQRNKSHDQYDYLTNTLRLKLNSGVLCPSDLQKINAWLDKRMDVHTVVG